MRFVVRRASAYNSQPLPTTVEGEDGRWYLDVNSLDEVLAIADTADCGVIVGRDYDKHPRLLIYDDYLE